MRYPPPSGRSLPRTGRLVCALAWTVPSVWRSDRARDAGAWQAAAQAIGLKVALKAVSAQDFIDFFVDPKFRAGVGGFPGLVFGDSGDRASLLTAVVLLPAAD